MSDPKCKGVYGYGYGDSRKCRRGADGCGRDGCPANEPEHDMTEEAMRLVDIRKNNPIGVKLHPDEPEHDIARMAEEAMRLVDIRKNIPIGVKLNPDDYQMLVKHATPGNPHSFSFSDLQVFLDPKVARGVPELVYRTSFRDDPRSEWKDVQKIEFDRRVYGTGFGRLRTDGSLEHIPAETVLIVPSRPAKEE